MQGFNNHRSGRHPSTSTRPRTTRWTSDTSCLLKARPRSSSTPMTISYTTVRTWRGGSRSGRSTASGRRSLDGLPHHIIWLSVERNILHFWEQKDDASVQASIDRADMDLEPLHRTLQCQPNMGGSGDAKEGPNEKELWRSRHECLG